MPIDDEKELSDWLIRYSDVDFGDSEPVAIGKGAFGSVYFARWHELEIAVKKLKVESDELRFTETQLKEFASEARVMKSIKPHPHLVRVC